jgi:amino acid adenylation domain-containing protein
MGRTWNPAATPHRQNLTDNTVDRARFSGRNDRGEPGKISAFTPNHSILRHLLDIPAHRRDRTMFASAAGCLSFGTVREGMLRFAGWLTQAAGIEPQDRVAICLPKSLEAAQAIYGVLAAGAAYVPLQFQGPPTRLATMIASVGPRLLLTTPEMAARLAAAARRAEMELPPVQFIAPAAGGTGLEHLLAEVPPAAAIAAAAPDALAAVYFTSGSTGEPKGVMLSHRNLAADLDWVPNWYGMTESDRRINQAGLHYIASLDLFYPAACGSSCFLLDDRRAMFPEEILGILQRERTTIWSSTATELRLLLDCGAFRRYDLSALRRVSFYGENMSLPLLRRLLQALPQVDFANMYGATETSEMAYFSIPRPLPVGMRIVPLGQPTDICTLSLRDEAGAEVAAGDVGEICVAGPAVTLGYWNDAALTAGKRVGGRRDSYRTGDFGFRGADGLLYLSGRKDNVVKLRGNCFNLSEIEAALKLHPAVRDAIAFISRVGPNDGEIRAAVLADAGPELEIELRRLCLGSLPSFARPVRIATLAEFPQLSTGKVDRCAVELAIGAAAVKSTGES